MSEDHQADLRPNKTLPYPFEFDTSSKFWMPQELSFASSASDASPDPAGTELNGADMSSTSSRLHHQCLQCIRFYMMGIFKRSVPLLHVIPSQCNPEGRRRPMNFSTI